MSVSRNGVYKIYDHMHVAFPRIIPRIMPPNHTRESYHESYPWFQQGRAKHTPKHTPGKHTSETYLESYPLMQHALLGTEFSERAIYRLTYLISGISTGLVLTLDLYMHQLRINESKVY